MTTIDVDGLADRLSTPDYRAHATRARDTIDLHWVGPVDRHVLVDRRIDDAAAEATLELRDGYVEWTRFAVEPDARGHGIYSAVVALNAGWLQDNGLWPMVISDAVHQAGFYASAGFPPSPDLPGFLALDDDAARDWLTQR